MALYLKLTDEGTAYPYSVAQLRADHPDTSFAADMPDERLAEWDVLRVAEAAPPDIDPGEVAEEAAPALIDGSWVQQWSVRTRTADELEAAKAALWETAKARRDAAVDSGCDVPGVGPFDTDPVSRSNINGAVTGAMIAQMAGQPFTVDWKLADNSITTLDGAEMISVGMAVLAHVAACHANAQTIGLAIQSADDFADLAAIDVEAGWP